jgi:hypothetical protein
VVAARVRFKESATERRRAISVTAAPAAGRAEGSEVVDVQVGARAAAVGGVDRMNAFFEAPLDAEEELK